MQIQLKFDPKEIIDSKPSTKVIGGERVCNSYFQPKPGFGHILAPVVAAGLSKNIQLVKSNSALG